MNQEEKNRNYRLGRALLVEQDFPRAILFGLGATAISATLWGIIAVVTGVVVGYMAVGVGALVGLSVRAGGRGIDNRFAVLAAALAVFGCLAGNLASAIILEIQVYGADLSNLVAQLDASLIVELLFAGVQWVDMLFWMSAAGAAAYLAKRKLSREEGLAIYTLRRRPNSHNPVT